MRQISNSARGRLAFGLGAGLVGATALLMGASAPHAAFHATGVAATGLAKGQISQTVHNYVNDSIGLVSSDLVVMDLGDAKPGDDIETVLQHDGSMYVLQLSRHSICIVDRVWQLEYCLELGEGPHPRPFSLRKLIESEMFS